MADERTVLGESKDGICRLTLNRPARLNAMNPDLLTSLHSHLAEAANDPAVRVIMIAGNGKGFCAGQDLNDRDPRKIDWPLDLEAIQKELFHPLVLLMRMMDKPIIVAVGGVAAGAGCSLALAGDIVIAAQSAKFIFSFAKVGLSADAGLGWQLVHALGPARARALLMTAATLGGADAAACGLVTKCVNDDALESEALSLARQFANGPALAYAGIKAAVRAAQEAPDLATYLLEEARLQGLAGKSDDYREGVLSFLESRPAQFRGR